MVDIAILGINGRMGRQLVDIIDARDDCRVMAGIDATAAPGAPWPMTPTMYGLDVMPKMPDVLIDFSHPTATLDALEYCAERALPCVICTTGLDENAKAQMRQAAESTAVFYSANMSLGINLLNDLIRKAQAMLQGFDVEIIEKHHHHKLDAPSGTALLLADTLNAAAGGKYSYVYDRHDVRRERGPNELGIHAVRGGSIVGEHEVLFIGPDEVVSLSHTAYSRNVFATGAVAAALFMAGRAPGMYSMTDLMEAL
ncbi:MAG: 4-hydroxy-tetrahydrodipicolinate reductase [Ruminococcaceae bacterium]|nr:4-hydroxy-tetrahydrodipicolinate reductase [Oscillospiraceae bacterium]